MKFKACTELKISVKRGYLFCTPSEPLIQQPTVAHNPVVNKKSLSSFKTPSSPFQLDQIYLSSYKWEWIDSILESLWHWKIWSHSVKSKNGIFGFTSKQAATTFISFSTRWYNELQSKSREMELQMNGNPMHSCEFSIWDSISLDSGCKIWLG